ncbi:MAG: HEAT repeat domain-containing protein [candidate division WOR-3 bacterium]
MRLAITLASVLLIACGNRSAKLRAQLADPDPDVRITAAKALGEARDTAAVMKLVEMLKDSIPDVRKEAARALGRIGDRRAARPLADFYEQERIEDVADAGARALLNLGHAAIDEFVRLTRSVRPSVRAGAARGLGRIGSRAGVDPLIRLLDDREEDVRIAAIHGLRQIGDARGLDAIARKVADEDEDVEAAAERALSGQGYEEELNRARRIVRRFR